MVIVATRIASFGFLLDSMIRIKKIIKEDLVNLPNIKMMAIHIIAFSGFILVTIPVIYTDIKMNSVHADFSLSK